MKRIRNIVFDLGGVLIDLDHHQAVSRFEEIGVKDAKQLLDPYENSHSDEGEGGKEYCVNAKTQYVILKQYL